VRDGLRYSACVVENGDTGTDRLARVYAHAIDDVTDYEGSFGLDHTTDIAYGFFNVRYIDRWQARQNADSYATMASEMWWKLTCEARLGPLGEPGFRDN
jgi:hypothetical protein